MLVVALLAVLGCGKDERCPEGEAVTTCDGQVVLTCSNGRIDDEATCADSETCVVGSGCQICDLDLPEILVAPIDTVEVPDDVPWRTLGWAAVTLEGSGTARFETDGPFEIFDLNALPVESLDLPTTVFVRGTTGGAGSLGVTLDGCNSGGSIALTARKDPGLSVTPRSAGVAASFVDAFPEGGTARVGIDPLRFPHHIGDEARVHIVPDIDRDTWIQSPPELGDPEATLVVGESFADNIAVLIADAEPEAIERYDIVIDWNGNGIVDAGDSVDGLDGPGFGMFPRLQRPGPYATRVREASASFFLTQRVYWPESIAEFETPAPLVVISHGNGHEYDWYDYLGEHLASWGYVVMSHRNDTQPGVETAATTTLRNTDAFVGNHADFEPDMAGKVDTERILWIGHSRGGEGILIAHERLRSGTANVDHIEASDIVLLSSIAPTVFGDPRDSSPGSVTYDMLTGSADGDVTGGVSTAFPFPGPCPLCQWWRLLQDGDGRQSVHYLYGSTHNDFNCCGFDDGSGINAPKADRPPTLRYTRTHYLTLLGAEVRGDPLFQDVVRRSQADFALPFADGLPAVTQSRQAVGEGLFLDHFQSENDIAVSSAGTAVRTTASDLAEGRLDDNNLEFAHNDSDGMNGMTQGDQDGNISARGAVFTIDGDTTWEVDLPEAERDVSLRRSVSMRVAQTTRHPNTVELGDSLAFAVGLEDGSGNEVILPTAAYVRVAAPYPRTGLGAGAGWANAFQTVRIDLVDFESMGLDLTDIRTLRLHFGPTHGSPLGRVGLDDVALEGP